MKNTVKNDIVILYYIFMINVQVKLFRTAV